MPSFFGRILHTCRNLLKHEHATRFKARIASVLKHANQDGHAVRAVIALGKIQRQQSERRRGQKLAGLVHIVSILLGHQPGNIGRALFQHANKRLSQTLDVLLTAVRIRKRLLCLHVLFAHAAEIFVDRIEECLVNVVFILHGRFFLSGCR